MATYESTINSIKSPQDCFNLRIKLIREIEQLTKRRLLVYVSDFRKPNNDINPEDKIGFSDLTENVDEPDVDILINSAGGSAEVAESLVGIIRSKYNSVRFAVPNSAKSAATLLCLSGNQLLMDHRSELGPIDPQISYPTNDGRKQEAVEDILEGFEETKKFLAEQGPAAIPAYVPLLSKYTIGLLKGCENAKELSATLAEKWLAEYMFKDGDDPDKPKKVKEYFTSRKHTHSHSRPILIDKCLELGMNVVDLRRDENKALASKLWQLWCLYALHFERSPVYKIYENSSGSSLQFAIQVVKVPLPKGPPRGPIQLPK
ncbi:MAG: hypothetical protein WC476_12415 [Phycisphaerae bacterium]|jgi:hypothetical protein